MKDGCRQTFCFIVPVPTYNHMYDTYRHLAENINTVPLLNQLTQASSFKTGFVRPHNEVISHTTRQKLTILGGMPLVLRLTLYLGSSCIRLHIPIDIT